MSSLISYLRLLCNRGEIDDDVYKKTRPIASNVSRAHGTPKIHKSYDHIPKFRPIIDTTGSPYHGVGKYLSSVLYPLTQNDFTVKDSFEAAKRVNSIPTDLFEEEYVYVSFDVESLFTNVPLDKTVDIIIDRVYNQNQIETRLRKRSLKKLILDSCRKTTFSFRGENHSLKSRTPFHEIK